MVEKTLLEKTALFGDLKDMEWDELLKITNEKKYEEGQIIFSEGHDSTELYMVFKGEVEIQIHIAPQLSESTVYVVKQFDVFGEFAFVDPNPRSATARCKTDCVLGIITRNDFEELVRRFPTVGLNFYKSLVRLLSERLRRMNTHLRDTFARCAGLDI
jgi:CRP-like cAMP-binding protein